MKRKDTEKQIIEAFRLLDLGIDSTPTYIRNLWSFPSMIIELFERIETLSHPVRRKQEAIKIWEIGAETEYFLLQSCERFRDLYKDQSRISPRERFFEKLKDIQLEEDLFDHYSSIKSIMVNFLTDIDSSDLDSFEFEFREIKIDQGLKTNPPMTPAFGESLKDLKNMDDQVVWFFIQHQLNFLQRQKFVSFEFLGELQDTWKPRLSRK